jgi:mRNA turnover protein 4
MPKSKRSKVVPLTKVQKKVRTLKEGLVNTVRQYLQRFNRMFLFSYEGMRSTQIRSIKEQLTSSKICLGKLRVMAVALGRTE